VLSVGPVSQAPAAGCLRLVVFPARSLLGQLPAKTPLIVAQLPASCQLTGLFLANCWPIPGQLLSSVNVRPTLAICRLVRPDGCPVARQLSACLIASAASITRRLYLHPLTPASHVCCRPVFNLLLNDSWSLAAILSLNCSPHFCQKYDFIRISIIESKLHVCTSSSSAAGEALS